MIVQQRDCIHWDICMRACPIDTNECKYYEKKHLPTTGKWLRVEGINAYQCSVCNTVGDPHKYFCSTCGSQNVLEED